MKPIDYEEEFHEGEKRDSRKERKRLSEKDRSKFKKSDAKKEVREPPKGNFLRGRVLALLADGILVDAQDILYTCTLKGSLKKEKGKQKNPITVGDFVHFDPHTLSIVFIEERYSVLSRAEALTKKREQLIAANIDQVIITASVGIPPLKPNLIDRYIIAALKGGLQPIIVINKIDLLDSETTLFEEAVKTYKALDIPTFPMSVVAGEGLDPLQQAMRGKASVFSGQSGTGKSSLINELIGTNLLTGEVIERTKKGAHTTTASRLLPLDEGGFVIDTPGIKGFGMWDIKPEEIQQYFVEIASIAPECKFPNCSHIHEPGCAVKAAVDAGKISRLRFASYSALMTRTENR